jgi:hypothetical protein
MDFGGAAEGYFKYKAAKKQAKVMKEQLEFQKKRYNDWYKVYGSLQEDLGTYFKNISGAELSAQERVAIEKAAQKAQEDLSKAMMQKGITNSGAEASLMQNIEWQSELQKALSAATADQKAAQMKMGFLSLGLGQGNVIAGQMNNAALGLSNVAGNSYKAIGQTLGYLGGLYGTTSNPTGSPTLFGSLFGGSKSNYNQDDGFMF